MSKQTKKNVGRRDFLRAAGAGAATAAAVSTIAGAPEAKAAENADTRKKSRYKETDHVKKFYDICRM